MPIALFPVRFLPVLASHLHTIAAWHLYGIGSRNQEARLHRVGTFSALVS
jgi:hypothetical protein